MYADGTSSRSANVRVQPVRCGGPQRYGWQKSFAFSNWYYPALAAGISGDTLNIMPISANCIIRAVPAVAEKGQGDAGGRDGPGDHADVQKHLGGQQSINTHNEQGAERSRA